MDDLEKDPILVLGAPRSGTTYLHRILDRHPLVAITNELRVLDWMHRALRELPAKVGGQMTPPNPFVDAMQRELPDLVRRYYRRLDPKARWWGDKNPHYAARAEILDTILELFPGTRFVHIVRDPRAVVASLIRKRHPDGQPWIAADQAHVMVVRHLQNALALGERVGSAYIRVSYEQLVADDVGVARRLFGSLGIPFADEVEAFCRAQMTERTPFSGPTTDLADPGDRSAARRAWRRAVPVDRLRESLQFLGPWLLRLGYEDAASLDAENRAIPDDDAPSV